ncbi:MAG: hypothetical protein KH038_09420, partial [Eubacterium sp.]|nr:hypothetical protein [Eubacterium sp.]
KYLEKNYDSSYKFYSKNVKISSAREGNSGYGADGVVFDIQCYKDDIYSNHNCECRVYLDGKRVLQEQVVDDNVNYNVNRLLMVIDPTYIYELNKEYYAYATFYDYDTGVEEKICGIYFVLYQKVVYEKTSVKLGQIAGKEQVMVSWTSVGEALKYEIYRSKYDENEYKLLYAEYVSEAENATTQEPEYDNLYLDSNVISGRKYSYYVKAYFNEDVASSISEKKEIVVDINADDAIPPEEIPTTTDKETTTEPPTEETTTEEETITDVETTTPYQQPTDEITQTSTAMVTETTTTRGNLETTTKTKGPNVPKKVKKSIHLKRPVLKVKRKSKARQIYWGIISDKSSGIELYMKNGMGKYKVFRKINTTTRLKRRKKKKGIVGILISNKSLVKGVKYKFQARTFVKVNKRKVYSKWSKIVIIKK